MDSKDILETFGISKNFGILLFIQSIIVIIGCFLAIQDVYFCFQSTINSMWISGMIWISSISNFLLFVVLIYYSFIGFRKNEKYFKLAVYLFIVSILISLFSCIIDATASNISSYYLAIIIGNIIKLILTGYFVYNLDNYDKAKIAILLVVLVNIIMWLFASTSGRSIELSILKLIYLIPIVSIALTYFARYSKKGFKQLSN